MPQPPLPVEPVPVLHDNYVWLFPTSEDDLAAVDPADAAPVMRKLDRRGKRLSHILITHHHHDHIDGVEMLKERYDAVVIGFQGDQHRLPPLDFTVADGDRIELGDRRVTVLEVPGHTSGHVAYLLENVLFSGDCLFSLGCGRLFEGTAAQMWTSLLKLRVLDDGTRLFPAHEYTLGNLDFARSLEPDHPGLAALHEELSELTDQDHPTLPSSLKREKRLNPFLRADDPALQRCLGMSGQPPERVFAEIRQRKDRF